MDAPQRVFQLANFVFGNVALAFGLVQHCQNLVHFLEDFPQFGANVLNVVNDVAHLGTAAGLIAGPGRLVILARRRFATAAAVIAAITTTIIASSAATATAAAATETSATATAATAAALGLLALLGLWLFRGPRLFVSRGWRRLWLRVNGLFRLCHCSMGKKFA
jgi:hypothetical protein